MRSDGDGNIVSTPGSTIIGHTHLQIDGAGNRTNVEVYGTTFKHALFGRWVVFLSRKFFPLEWSLPLWRGSMEW